jgi:COP9 signalosome complex subunit 2
MSDDEEYEYDYGSDADSMDEGGGSDNEGTTNKDGADEKIAVENAFYEAQDLESENPKEACRLFEQVIVLDTQLEAAGEPVVWRFKALQHLVNLNFCLHNYPEMVRKYQAMLKDMPLVTRNECTEAINSILETISGSQNDTVLVEMFEITLTALKTANNERLWFNTNLKLAKLYLNDIGSRQSEVEHLMSVLKQSCTLSDGTDNPAKASQLLEIYCLEITFCRMIHDVSRMATIYPKTLHLNAAVADPRIMGVIREEGGKMHMREEHWDEAFEQLNEAFRNFQQAGNNARAKTCLKYVALVSMLSKTAVNPFDGREAKVFEKDPEIVAMTELRRCLQENDLQRFEKVLSDRRNGIATEEVLMAYLEPLRRRMREHVLQNLIRPYKKVTLAFLARELHISEDNVEKMLVCMIQQGDLGPTTKIDQIHGSLLLGEGDSISANKKKGKESVAEKKAKAMGAWADALMQINRNLSQPFA